MKSASSITTALMGTTVYQVNLHIFLLRLKLDVILYFTSLCYLTGCRFGEMSKMLGFSNTWVQFPTSSLACPYNSCNEVCYCTTKSELQQCHTPAFQPFESCWIADYQIGKSTLTRHFLAVENPQSRCQTDHFDQIR